MKKLPQYATSAMIQRLRASLYTEFHCFLNTSVPDYRTEFIMELLQLKYFCDAANTENFSKTANKYLVPTSSISQSIKRLEKELGCELFEHYANKIVLNNSGKLFYSDVSQSLSLLERAKSRIIEEDGELQGDIHLACMSNRKKVTDAIEKFIKENPKVNFIIYHRLEADKNIDIIISDICPFEYSRRVLIVDEEIRIAMNTRHPLASKENLTASDLENERFITMTQGSSLHRITVRTCTDAGFAPNIVIQTDDPFYLRKYIEIGLGIAFIPMISWGGMFSDDIVLRNIDNIQRKTYAFLPKGRYVNRSVEAFLQMLES